MNTADNVKAAKPIKIIGTKSPAEASRAINSAIEIISSDGLVAMPTETVYGLAADAASDVAVAKIFEAKGRPQFNPLIVHVTGVEMAARYVAFPPLAQKLAAAFWPGPLTIVLPRHTHSGLSLLISAGLETIAVRAPKSPVAQQLIAAIDRPLAAPSANRSGAVSPTEAAHVVQSLGAAVDLIIDAGPCPVGVESTIVKIDEDEVYLLRPGGLARAEIEEVISAELITPAGAAAPQAPGMLASHYAPGAALRLNAERQEDGEAFLGFGAIKGDGPYALNLSKTGNLREAAANFFAHLRTLDAICAEHGLIRIAVASIPQDGLGEAISDRLTRAAAPRI